MKKSVYMYFLLHQTLFILPARIPSRGKKPTFPFREPLALRVTQGHQGAAPRHSLPVETAGKCVCAISQ